MSNMCDIYILQLENISIGQIRLDYCDDMAILSYAICKEYRGYGYAQFMIKEIIKNMKNNYKCKKIIAYVKKSNESSKHIFEKLDFKYIDMKTHDMYEKLI